MIIKTERKFIFSKGQIVNFAYSSEYGGGEWKVVKRDRPMKDCDRYTITNGERIVSGVRDKDMTYSA